MPKITEQVSGRAWIGNQFYLVPNPMLSRQLFLPLDQ